MKARVSQSLSRRRALAPIAGFAFAALALSRATAQVKTPGSTMTAQQTTRVNAALANLQTARTRITTAFSATVRQPTRLLAAIDSAISECKIVASGRWR